MPVKNPSTQLRAGIIPGQTVTKEKLQRARPLCPSDISPFSKNENGESRRDMTPAEKILWQELRGNKLGVHFRRQQVTPALACWCKCCEEGAIPDEAILNYVRKIASHTCPGGRCQGSALAMT